MRKQESTKKKKDRRHEECIAAKRVASWMIESSRCVEGSLQACASVVDVSSVLLQM